MIDIFPIPAFQDNYIWCLNNNRFCAVVDPGEANSVLHAIEQRGLKLAAILLTHRHSDHTGGVTKLLEHNEVPVFGPHAIAQVTTPVTTKVSIPYLDLDFSVMTIPGHTLEHVAYYHPGIVFSGDTLFTAGCGKVFEGTTEQMYCSLLQFRSLPDDTLVYCGHEYTEKNLHFALTVEPHNAAIHKRLREVAKLRHHHIPTVPEMIKIEKMTNPFFRCEEAEVIAAASNQADKPLNNPIEVFEVLREWKNSF